MYQGTRWVLLKQKKQGRKSHALAPLKGKLNPRIKKKKILPFQNGQSSVNSIYQYHFQTTVSLKQTGDTPGNAYSYTCMRFFTQFFFHQKTRTGPLIQILIYC